MTKLRQVLGDRLGREERFPRWTRRAKPHDQLFDVPSVWDDPSQPVEVHVPFVTECTYQTRPFETCKWTTWGTVHSAGGKAASPEPIVHEAGPALVTRAGAWESIWSLFELITWEAAKVAPESERLLSTEQPMQSLEVEGVDPELRSREIVRSLTQPDLDPDDRRKLVIEAETLPFRGEQLVALTGLLRLFIEQYRNSNVPADLVAVGAAIRKFIAIAPTEQAFGAAASLLKSGERLALPIEIELEVCKMVVRKLASNPPAARDHYSELALRLEELVDTYAKPRLLAREKHGAVALNAILGLVLTRSGDDSAILDRARALGVGWFQTLLGRRAGRLRSDLKAGCSAMSLGELLDVLGALSDLANAGVVS